MYRLCPKSRWTPIIMTSGLLLFILSRVVQLVELVGLFHAMFSVSSKAVWYVQSALVAVFQVIQLKTIHIHWTLLRKLDKAAGSVEERREKNLSLDGRTIGSHFSPCSASESGSFTKDIDIISEDSNDQNISCKV